MWGGWGSSAGVADRRKHGMQVGIMPQTVNTIGHITLSS